MAKAAKILVICFLFASCKKAEVNNCYKCSFGTISVGGVNYTANPEIHCEPGSENYKKYLTVQGTIINNWQFPTSCKLNNQ